MMNYSYIFALLSPCLLTYRKKLNAWPCKSELYLLCTLGFVFFVDLLGEMEKL